jgi:hypothetical protein
MWLKRAGGRSGTTEEWRTIVREWQEFDNLVVGGRGGGAHFQPESWPGSCAGFGLKGGERWN